MNSKLILAFVSLSMLLSLNCNDKPPIVPPEAEAKITLTLQDTTCTEAWLELKIADLSPPHNYKIYRDSTLTFAGTLFASDTMLIDTALLPRRQYNYKALRLENGFAKDSSAVLQIKTMDTTSHEITWTVETIGDGASSILYDVAIVNDTLAYAVGKIALKDSSGNIESETNNMAIWNGKEWKVKKIYFSTICGIQGRTSYPASSIFVLDALNTWMSMEGDQITHWNGFHQTSTMCIPVSFTIKKLWGSKGNLLYAVGGSGNIEQFRDNNWHSLTSGTTANINDVWGVEQEGAEPYVLAAATSLNKVSERKLIQIRTDSVNTLKWNSNIELHSVWFVSPRKIFAVGDGAHVGIINEWKKVKELPSYFKRRVRGTAKNDVWVVGDFGLCAHYNGYTWKSFPETGLNGIYHGLAVTSREVIAVGEVNGKAVILRGIK
jgi:hypothetical protein